MRRTFLIPFLFLFLSQALFAFQDEQLVRISEKLREKLEDMQRAAKFPGATAGFVLPDGRSGSVAIGLADRENKVPLKPADHMPAGSIGKTFVAAEALLLAENGKLNLDEKIQRWLGDKPWFAKLPNAKDITLRMLLNHSSGISNHVDDGRFIKALFRDFKRDIKYAELVAYVLNKKPLFPAGGGHHYSDTNYILIGMIIEKVTGKTLYDEISDRILKPLKLEDTFPSNKRLLPGVVNGYFQNKPVIVNGEFIVNPQWEWTGGGFASNPEDLARWAAALYGGGFLRPASLDEMLRGIKTDEGPDYGLGVIIVKSRWGKAYGHDGEFPGYLSDMRYFPDHKLSVAVQFDLDETPEMERISSNAIDELAQAILGEMYAQDFSPEKKLGLQKSAEDWIKLLEGGKYSESWEAASADFKTSITKEIWRSKLQAIGKILGQLKARKFRDLIYVKPNDEFVVVNFESPNGKLPMVIETVVLKLEKDGQWRVRSYSIH